MNPIQALQKILTDYGRDILKNHRQVEALFKDLCNESQYKREINILILVLKADIPQKLINNSSINNSFKLQLGKQLEDDYSIPVEHGKVAIETWEKALYPQKISTPKPSVASQQPVKTNATQPIIKPSQHTPSVNNELAQGIWTDPKTGLMWVMSGISKKRWHEAVKTCENLNLGGYNDWRLPTINELEIYVKHSKFIPLGRSYWSSSEQNDKAWVISNTGQKFEEKKIWAYSIVAVRGYSKISFAENTVQQQSSQSKSAQLSNSAKSLNIIDSIVDFIASLFSEFGMLLSSIIQIIGVLIGLAIVLAILGVGVLVAIILFGG